MSVMGAIRKEIESFPAGEPFACARFLELGRRASVDQALSRLIKAGKIVRVTRGVFVRPKKSRFGGFGSPEPLRVAQALAQATGRVVEIHGAEAARRFELSTQVPMKPVFLTNGPTRRFRIRNLEVVLKHTSPKKLILAGRPAGEALSALWYLGKSNVTPSTIASIRSRLGPKEFAALVGAISSMPSWMIDAIREERSAHG